MFVVRIRAQWVLRTASLNQDVTVQQTQPAKADLSSVMTERLQFRCLKIFNAVGDYAILIP